MSRIRYKLSELATQSELYKVDKLIDTICNCGNCHLEIEIDLDCPKNVIDFIKQIHNTDCNHSVCIINKGDKQ